MKNRLFIISVALALSAGFASLALSHALPGKIHTQDMSTPVFLKKFWGRSDEAAAPVSENAYEISSDEDFEKKTRIFAQRPFNKSEFFFNINLPDDWVAESIADNTGMHGSQSLLGDIASFRSQRIGTMQAFVFVQALRVDHEISAANWLRHHILNSTYTPEGEIEEVNRHHANTHYVYIRDGVSYHVYATVRLNGETALVARFETPLPLKDYLAFVQKKSIDSFALVYPSESNVEPQKVFTMVDSIKFGYPQSWQVVAPDFKDVNRLSAQLHNKNEAGNVEGFIYALAVRREPGNSLLKEVDKLKTFFDEQIGIDFKSLVFSGTSPAYKRFTFNRLETYHVESRKKGQSLQEVHLVVLGDEEWYVFLFLITPRESERFYTWARNVQSFNDVIESIK